MRKRIVLCLVLLLTASVAAKDLRAIFQPYNISSEDQMALAGSLLAAVSAVTPYQHRALGADETLPPAVPNFLKTARKVAQRYEISSSDILSAVAVAVGSSGRIPATTSEKAFQPLQSLLARHKVSGVAALDMVTPPLLDGMTEMLRKPPAERAKFRHPQPTPEQVARVASFAREHGISLPKLLEAMQSLRQLRPG